MRETRSEHWADTGKYTGQASSVGSNLVTLLLSLWENIYMTVRLNPKDQRSYSTPNLLVITKILKIQSYSKCTNEAKKRCGKYCVHCQIFVFLVRSIFLIQSNIWVPQVNLHRVTYIEGSISFLTYLFYIIQRILYFITQISRDHVSWSLRPFSIV